jgi:hypothetical protein
MAFGTDNELLGMLIISGQAKKASRQKSPSLEMPPDAGGKDIGGCGFIAKNALYGAVQKR